MTVGELCNREVVLARVGDTVFDAARRMRQFHVGDLVVVEDEAGGRVPVGIVTDRDLVVAALAEGIERLSELRVGDVMTPRPVTAHAGEGVVEALDRMRSHGIRRLPVVNEEGRLEGILAFDDVLEFTSGELLDLVKLVARQQKVERQRRI